MVTYIIPYYRINGGITRNQSRVWEFKRMWHKNVYNQGIKDLGAMEEKAQDPGWWKKRCYGNPAVLWAVISIEFLSEFYEKKKTEFYYDLLPS